MTIPKQSDLLKALYARLSDDPTVYAFVAERVFNHVPQQAENLPKKPYIRFFVVSASDWGTKNELGYDVEIQVDVWSDMRGDEEPLDIMDAVISSCHNVPLPLVTGQDILLQHAGSNTFIEPDGITHHGVVRLRAITSQT